MTHENQPLEARSPFARGPRRGERRISRIFPATNAGTTAVGQCGVAELRAYRQICRPVVLDRPKGDDGALPTSSAGATWWRAVTATASGLMVQILGLAARGEAGFSDFLLAAASMYPITLEPPDRLDPADEQKPDVEDSKQANRHSRRSSCMTLLESPALPGVSFRKYGRRTG